MSTFPIPIDEQVKQITTAAIQNGDKRSLAIAHEAGQAYIEYLDWLKDNITFDQSVTIEVNEARIKFKNDIDFSNWLAEQMG